MVDHQVAQLITQDDMKAWLADHGLDIAQTCEATIRLSDGRNGCRAWLDATWYKLDERGRKYRDPDDCSQPAMGTSTIPLTSWPPLTQPG